MTKQILAIAAITVFFLFNAAPALAGDRAHGYSCTPSTDVCLDKKDSCLPDLDLLQNGKPIFDKDTNPYYKCRVSTVKDVIGQIQPPPPLKNLLGTDPTGAGAISHFLSNLVILFFSLAGIVLLFMILWGAFEWMASGGEKEKVASARSRIINAIIGMILFAVAFAALQIFGQFTGFKFFRNQAQVIRNSQGTITGSAPVTPPLFRWNQASSVAAKLLMTFVKSMAGNIHT